MTSALSNEEVHLLVLETGENRVAAADLAVLSVDERQRAAAIVAPGERHRFVACRIALRRLMSRHTGVAAAEIGFSYTPLGKPELASPHESLVFSVSHSADVGLIAVARSKEGRRPTPLGVDVERVDSDVDALELGGTAFAPEEIAELERRDGAARTELFYRLWTHREAVSKALGVGLRADPAQLYVDVVGSDEPRVVRVADDRSPPGDWTLREIDVSGVVAGTDAYRAALAIDRPLAGVKQFACRSLAELADVLGG